MAAIENTLAGEQDMRQAMIPLASGMLAASLVAGCSDDDNPTVIVVLDTPSLRPPPDTMPAASTR